MPQRKEPPQRTLQEVSNSLDSSAGRVAVVTFAAVVAAVAFLAPIFFPSAGPDRLAGSGPSVEGSGDFVPFSSRRGRALLEHLSGEHNESLLWGTYRPGVLFGVKSRTIPESVVVGLLWTSVAEKEGVLRADASKLRHTCEESETRQGLRFGFSEHDGSSYGKQLIEDPGNKVSLQTYFYKKDSSTWAMRVAGTASKGKKALFIYVGVDAEFEADYSRRASSSVSLVEEGDITVIGGKTPSLGAFRLLTLVGGASSSIPVANRKVLAWAFPKGTPVANIKGALEEGLRAGGGTEKAPAVLQSPVGVGTSESIIVLQLVVKEAFEVDVIFDGGASSGPADPVASQLGGDGLTAKLHAASQAFHTRFEETFQLSGQKSITPEQVTFAESALSAMLGGVGYFYGSSQVKQADKGSVPSPAMPLFTAVPSRSFFPRGFLWDEGFHQMLIGRWDPAMSRDVIAHWFGLMREDGWIAREQILGAEAVSKVPDWAVPQHPSHANPPTLLLAIEALLERSAPTGAGDGAAVDADTAKWLAAVFPAVERWFEWFRTSQVGSKKLSFRWHGRDPKDGKLNAMTLSSGLDDYPRASAVSDEERHVDLHSWVAFGAGVLARVAEFAGESHSKVGDFRRMQDELLQSLDELHWDAKRKRYCDYGLHSNDGQYVPHIVVKCGTADGSHSVEHTMTKEEYIGLQQGRNKRPCPADYPKFMFPLGDGQGGLMMREKFKPKKEKLQFVDHVGYVSLFPLLLRLLPPDSPRLPELLDLLGDPSRGLWSDFGLRSLAKGDKMYLRDNAPGDAPYWRGPIWINCNFLAVNALRYYASREGPNRERAGQLLERLSGNLVRNMFENFQETGYLWEQYNPHDGKGQRTHPFNGWSSLVVLMMAP